MTLGENTYLVLGLARTGLAAVTWLRNRGANVIAKDADPRKILQAIDLGAQTCDDQDIDWSSISALIQSPGIPLTHSLSKAARDRSVPVFGDVDLFRHFHSQAKIIGITGTNGKSTTATLIAHILESAGLPVAIGGNVGVPVLSLPELPPEGIYVLELSSYQLDLSDCLNLDYVGWLNITPDHLERHGSMDEYIRAKAKIFRCTVNFPETVICLDDDYSQGIYNEIHMQNPQQVTAVSCEGEGASYRVLDAHLIENEDEIADLRSFDRLSGRHNYQNIAVAYGLCRKVGLTPKQILRGIASFPGLVHRQEWIAEIEGVTFVNDSKATNGEAASKALDTFDEIYWIAGGEPKSDGITMLVPYFTKIKRIFLIGAAQERFVDVIGSSIPVSLSGDLKTAIQQAFEAARLDISAGFVLRPIVLLSPACASFDQFRDFEHRGEVFKEQVLKIN